jgi:hypothetical protein
MKPKNSKILSRAIGHLSADYLRLDGEADDAFLKRAIQDGVLAAGGPGFLCGRPFGRKSIAKLADALGLEVQVRFVIKRREVTSLGMSVRATQCLLAAGLDTVAKVAEKGKRGLLRTRHFGSKSIKEIEERFLAPDVGIVLKE